MENLYREYAMADKVYQLIIQERRRNMFSVNIDKIVGMTDNEKKCYEELRENLKKELNGGKVLAITKNGIGAFKIAYSFVCAGEKVLFIDADIMSEIFLGKYNAWKESERCSRFFKKTFSNV